MKDTRLAALLGAAAFALVQNAHAHEVSVAGASGLGSAASPAAQPKSQGDRYKSSIIGIGSAFPGYTAQAVSFAEPVSYGLEVGFKYWGAERSCP